MNCGRRAPPVTVAGRTSARPALWDISVSHSPRTMARDVSLRSKKPRHSPGYSFGASRPNARRHGLRFHQTKSVTSRFCACRPKRVPRRVPRFSHTFARSAPRAGPDPPCAGSPENFSMGHHREIPHTSVDDYEEPVLRSLRQRPGENFSGERRNAPLCRRAAPIEQKKGVHWGEISERPGPRLPSSKFSAFRRAFKLAT